MLSNILDKISFWSLFFVVVLLPVFFLPFTRIPVETSKGFFLVIGLVVSIIFWAAARFSDGKVIFPKSYVLLSGFGVVLAIFISALFSGASGMSFFGIMFDIGTFWFMLSAFMLMFMSSIVFKKKENAKMVLLGVIVSLVVVFVFQLLRLFMPEFLSFSVLGGKTDNLIGSWNTFGLLAGFSAISSLFLIEFFAFSKKIKSFLGFSIALSIVMAMVVNFSLVWKLLGIFALIIFVYKISFSSNKGQQEHKAHFPIFSFGVILVSLLFFMSGQFIGGYIPSRLGLLDVEVSPSFASTMEVTWEALKSDPVVGIGPNRFDQVWAMHKPQLVNNTVFWNTSFSSGYGLLPTFISTTGSLGILAWLLFLFSFLALGVKMIFSSIKKSENAEIMLFFIIALYLFVSLFFYSGGSVVFLLALSFTGIFVGILSGKSDREISISFLNDPRKSFFFILFLVLLMIISAALSFKYIERFASISSFGKALGAQTIEEAESFIGRAVVLHSNDVYMRTYSQIYITKMNELASKGDAISDTEKAQLQEYFDEAVNSAILATQYNKKNYLNFQALGSVYSNVASLGLTDAYAQSIDAYQQASQLNPLNPGLKLAIANLFFVDGKTAEAREIALEALALKPNYIDLLVTLSQIEKRDGNQALALSYGEKALQIAPSDEDLIQYVSSLRGFNSPASVVNTPVENNINDTESTEQ
jgi:tetratricopeptide (TPR) repeat protein